MFARGASPRASEYERGARGARARGVDLGLDASPWRAARHDENGPVGRHAPPERTARDAGERPPTQKPARELGHQPREVGPGDERIAGEVPGAERTRMRPPDARLRAAVVDHQRLKGVCTHGADGS